MSPMSTFSIQKPQFRFLLFNGSLKPCNSWNMSMDSRFSSTVNGNSDMKIKKKKKEELSVSVEETLRSDGLRFDRLQPSDYELVRERRFEFGQFVARDAVLDEEYWTAAWLRAESHWENRTYERYVDIYKRKFAEQEFNAVKRRCKVQNGDSCACIITVRKEQKNVKRSIIKSVVGTLDLNIRYLLQGETFPGERAKTPFSCSTNRTPPSRYGYIANLCVTKSARRQGIASNMMYFAVESAKSNGVRQVYVHVDRNNNASYSSYSDKKNSMAAMREMIFRMAVMQPVNIDPETIKPPKRKNVKISKDPQSVAARHRRERISERIRILQRLVPGGTKMDTASMLDEAIHYVKFLKKQVQTLEQVGANKPMNVAGFPGMVSNGNLNYSSFLRGCSTSSPCQMMGPTSKQMLS